MVNLKGEFKLNIIFSKLNILLKFNLIELYSLMLVINFY